MREGFTRRRNQYSFARYTNVYKHKIELRLNFDPRFTSGHEVLIQPMWSVAFPALAKDVENLVGGNSELVAGSFELALMRPVMRPDNCGSVFWLGSDADGIETCLSEIALELQSELIPMLNRFSSVEGIIDIHDDPEIAIVGDHTTGDHRWFVFLIAALIRNGQKERGRQVAERIFGRGMKERYSEVLAYFDRQ